MQVGSSACGCSSLEHGVYIVLLSHLKYPDELCDLNTIILKYSLGFEFRIAIVLLYCLCLQYLICILLDHNYSCLESPWPWTQQQSHSNVSGVLIYTNH